MSAMRLFVQARDYSSCILTDIEINKPIELENFSPLDHKLLSGDVFQITEQSTVEVTHSPVKTSTYLAGVLQLSRNNTYGRTENKKRLLYQCIPDDKHLPVFLVPYEIKLGLSKDIRNKYVLFRFDNWSDKHPRGMLVEVLGDVDQLTVFYEYQLYCKNLHESFTEFNRKARKVVDKHSFEEHVSAILRNPNFCVEDRRQENVFTIDPKNSTDFDDGFSIQKMEDGNWRVSVYIANVFIWIEQLGLWNSLSNRVATIYLPDRRRPMLPTILSDTLCSLQENQNRFAFAVDFILNETGQLISGTEPNTYRNVLIRVAKNYHYEETSLVTNNVNYCRLLDLSQKMDKHVQNSHDLVSFWMVQTNSRCGHLMCQKKIGIFRAMAFTNSTTVSPKIEELSLSTETSRVITNWNNTVGQYLLYNEDSSIMDHKIMNLKTYIHITSPIRRLVDILNQIMIVRELGIVKSISKEGSEFLDKWTMQMDFINSSMRSVRKIQIDCDTIHRCFTDTTILEKEHTGIVFDKVNRNDGTITYMVYLEDMKLLSRVNCRDELSNYTSHKFRVYLFENEDQTRKKIRLSLSLESLTN